MAPKYENKARALSNTYSGRILIESLMSTSFFSRDEVYPAYNHLGGGLDVKLKSK